MRAHCAQFSDDGELVVSASEDNTVREKESDMERGRASEREGVSESARARERERGTGHQLERRQHGAWLSLSLTHTFSHRVILARADDLFPVVAELHPVFKH